MEKSRLRNTFSHFCKKKKLKIHILVYMIIYTWMISGRIFKKLLTVAASGQGEVDFYFSYYELM